MKRTYRTVSETVSTNTELKKEICASPSPCFSVLRAEKQTGGRGRLGRSFFSPEGGLYFSAAFPMRKDAENIPFFTLLCGLAASEAIDGLCGVKTEIKWPNDVYLNGRKLGGILCELVTGKHLTAVAGFGINLTLPRESIPEELREKMTSLCAEGVPSPDPEVLTRRITGDVDRLLGENDPASALAAIRARSFSVGKRVFFDWNGKSVGGLFTDIAGDGAAVIMTDGGETVTVRSGELRIADSSRDNE